MPRIILFCLLTFPLLAQEADPRTDALVTLDGYFPFEVPPTLADWQARREVVRRRVLVAAGLWPEVAPVEPNTVIWGPVQRDGYTVSRIHFESLPGYHVTGSLYRPTGDGPFPGILCAHGHWANGRFSNISDKDSIAQIERGEEEHLANAKFHLQARCAQLARLGCVVLHYDMIGYADSQQLEHWAGFGDAEAELWALNPFGVQTRNSLQALEVLLDLEGVDATRIGVTGGSGGGTQTFILGAIDQRPSLLFPAVMASTAMQGGCVCENASHLRVDTGNIELAAMAAPRPLALTGADDWTKEILTKGYPELKQLYALHGVPERVQAWCYPQHPHNYNAVARQHLYAFVNEHFQLGHAQPIVEPELLPVHVDDLTVYSAAYPRPGGGVAEVRAELRRIAEAERARLVELAGTDLDTYRQIVGGALEVMLDADAPLNAQLEEGKGELHLNHPSGTARFHLTGGAERARLILADYPTLTLAAAMCDDPGLAVTHPFRGELRTNHRNGYVLYTHGYNLTHIAQRARDLRVITAGVGEAAPALLGEGFQARAALLAAAADRTAFGRVAIELRGFDGIEDSSDPDFLPGVERWGGAEGLAALIAPTPLLLLGTDEVPDVIRRAYATAGAESGVRAVLTPDPAELRAWLLGD